MEVNTLSDHRSSSSDCSYVETDVSALNLLPTAGTLNTMAFAAMLANSAAVASANTAAGSAYYYGNLFVPGVVPNVFHASNFSREGTCATTPLNLSGRDCTTSRKRKLSHDADDCPAEEKVKKAPSESEEAKDSEDENLVVSLDSVLCKDEGDSKSNETAAKDDNFSSTCTVCGDISSGKHYGIQACNGCSGFFKRSVRRKLIYRCQAGTGTCLIDKQHRNQCQACRLKKCLQMGMNKDAVQNERQPRNTATIRPENLLTNEESERLIREGVASSVFHPIFGSSGESCYSKSSSSLEESAADNFLHVASGSGSGSGTNNNSSSNSSISSQPTIFHPIMEDSIFETAHRLLFMAIKWVKTLPAFVSIMVVDDQLALLKECWSELFLICAIEWSLPFEHTPLFTVFDSNLNKQSKCVQDVKRVSDIVCKFRQLNVDATEFACLKALSLFRSEAKKLKQSVMVEKMQDQILMMLLHHEKYRNDDNPTRFGKLLLLLASLRLISPNNILYTYFPKFLGIEKTLLEMFNSS